MTRLESFVTALALTGCLAELPERNFDSGVNVPETGVVNRDGFSNGSDVGLSDSGVPDMRVRDAVREAGILDQGVPSDATKVEDRGLQPDSNIKDAATDTGIRDAMPVDQGPEPDNGPQVSDADRQVDANPPDSNFPDAMMADAGEVLDASPDVEIPPPVCIVTINNLIRMALVEVCTGQDFDNCRQDCDRRPQGSRVVLNEQTRCMNINYSNSEGVIVTLTSQGDQDLCANTTVFTYLNDMSDGQIDGEDGAVISQGPFNDQQQGTAGITIFIPAE